MPSYNQHNFSLSNKLNLEKSINFYQVILSLQCIESIFFINKKNQFEKLKIVDKNFRITKSETKIFKNEKNLTTKKKFPKISYFANSHYNVT